MEEPKNVVLKIDDAVMHVDAHWLRRFSSDFLAAALAFSPPETRFSPVPYFLACRSIELSLKCFLVASGVSRAELKNPKRIGHDLEAALSRASKLGIDKLLGTTPQDRPNLKSANELYCDKEFEYFESLGLVYGPSDAPDLDVLVALAQRLVDATEVPSREGVFRERGVGSSEDE